MSRWCNYQHNYVKTTQQNDVCNLKGLSKPITLKINALAQQQKWTVCINIFWGVTPIN